MEQVDSVLIKSLIESLEILTPPQDHAPVPEPAPATGTPASTAECSWTCSECFNTNAGPGECSGCGAAKTDADTANGWACQYCGMMNVVTTARCKGCDKWRPKCVRGNGGCGLGHAVREHQNVPPVNWSHGGCSWPGLDPKGGGGRMSHRGRTPPPLQTPKWVFWAPEILFSAYGRGEFFSLTLCVYTQNAQNFVENSKMDEKHTHKKKILTPTRSPGRTLADGSLS